MIPVRYVSKVSPLRTPPIQYKAKIGKVAAPAAPAPLAVRVPAPTPASSTSAPRAIQTTYAATPSPVDVASSPVVPSSSVQAAGIAAAGSFRSYPRSELLRALPSSYKSKIVYRGNSSGGAVAVAADGLAAAPTAAASPNSVPNEPSKTVSSAEPAADNAVVYSGARSTTTTTTTAVPTTPTTTSSSTAAPASAIYTSTTTESPQKSESQTGNAAATVYAAIESDDVAQADAEESKHAKRWAVLYSQFGPSSSAAGQIAAAPTAAAVSQRRSLQLPQPSVIYGSWQPI